MEFLDAPPLPFYFSAEHEAFRAGLRAFVAREIAPFVAEWDEAETFRAISTGARPNSACWAWAIPRRSAARRPTCSII